MISDLEKELKGKLEEIVKLLNKGNDILIKKCKGETIKILYYKPRNTKNIQGQSERET